MALFRRGRGLVGGGRAANARRVELVEYAGHPAADNRTAELTEMTTRGMRGLSGAVYVGDRGDPERSFGGVGPRLQDLTGAANATGNPIVFRNSPAEIDTATDTVITDPALRIFAERMRRRR